MSGKTAKDDTCLLALKKKKNLPEILWDIVSNSLLMSFQFMLQLSPIIVTMTMIGHYYSKSGNSAKYLSGSGLARTLSNTINLAFSYGMTSGLWTLIPQTIGGCKDKPDLYKKLITIYVKRSLYLVIILSTALNVIQFFAGDILVAIGQPVELREIVNNYCRMLIPYNYLMCFNGILQTLIQSLGFNKMLFALNLIAFIIDVICLYLLIFVANLGYIGGALTASIFMFFTLLGNIFIVCKIKHSFIFKPMKLSLIFDKKGIIQYLSLALPGIFQMSFEWLVLEIVVLLSGYVTQPTISIATTVIITNFDLVTFGFQNRVGTTMSIEVGKYIGSGMVSIAKKYSYVGVCYSNVISIIFVLILYFTRNIISYLWTKDERVIHLTTTVIYIYMIYVFNNGFKAAIQGIYRGLGLQKISSYFVIFGYWFVAIPLCLLLLFLPAIKLRDNLYLGTQFIWICVTIGNVISGYGVGIHLLLGYAKYNISAMDSQKRITMNVQQCTKYGSFDHDTKTSETD